MSGEPSEKPGNEGHFKESLKVFFVCFLSLLDFKIDDFTAS